MMGQDMVFGRFMKGRGGFDWLRIWGVDMPLPDWIWVGGVRGSNATEEWVEYTMVITWHIRSVDIVGGVSGESQFD